MEKSWVEHAFIEKGRLFMEIMESKPLLEHGKRTVENIVNYLESKGIKEGKILEVGCGTGRILIPLAGRGFFTVGIDISPLYIEKAKAKAEESDVKNRTIFIVGDARRLKEYVSRYAPFNVILFVWTTVIGYFDEETEIQILRQCRELATPDALLIIIETASHDYKAFINHFIPEGRSYMETEKYVVLEEAKYHPETSIITSKWTYYKKQGRDLKYIGEIEYPLRVYALHELINMAEKAGWKFLEAFQNIGERTPFRPLSSLNVVFQKSKGRNIY